MDRALWLLMGLRLWGWLRRLGRSVGTVRGALLVAAGALVFLPWVVSWLLAPTPTGQYLAEVRRLGPLALAAYCLVQLVLTTEGAITFSAAEVNFLFPAPLSRRQVLAYKVLGTLGTSLLSTLLLTLFLRQYAVNMAAAAVGLLLAVMFMQLFQMALALLASSVGARAYSRRRKIVLAVLVLLAAVAVAPAVARTVGKGGEAMLAEVEASPVAQAVLAPFAWFVNAFTAERLWPDLVQWAGLGLLLNLALLVLVFTLDAHYLETSAAVSERAYARLERLRRGGPTTAALLGWGKARLSVPSLPHWGGVGPLAWRQLTTALRAPWALAVVVIVMGVFLVPSLAEGPRRATAALDTGLTITLFVAVAIFVPPLLPFDFRGDIDRMEVLKTLPVPSWRLVVGQLLTPVAFVSGLQLVFFGVLLALGGRIDALLLAGGAFVLPINSLLFELDNLLFLWFPTRQLSATPGDLQNMGRQIVLWMVKLLALWLVGGLAALAGFIAYLVGGGSAVAAGVVGWVVLAGFVVGLVPLLALAFRHFDVARDTP